MSTITESTKVFDIPTSLIRPDPSQPRKEFDPEYIAALGESIAAEGLLQPITVRPDPEKAGAYIIIAGECRWRAHCHKGLQAVRCMISDDKGDEAKRFRAQVMENMGRRQMTLKEEAFACERMAGLGDSDPVIGKAIGISAKRVGVLRRMTKLADDIWFYLDKGEIQRRAAEWVMGCVPDSHVDGVLRRCVGKNQKQAVAVVSKFLLELNQQEFELAFLQSGASERKNDLVRGIAGQILAVGSIIKGLTNQERIILARSIGSDIVKVLPRTKETKQAAMFVLKACSQIDAEAVD